jgi:hypothetical protein
LTRSIRGTLVLVGATLVALGSLCGNARAVSVTFTGPEEMVFDYTTMRCADGDIPDGPVYAFRDSNGRVSLMIPSIYNRRDVGPDFNNLTHDCTSMFPSAYDPNPAHYSFNQYLNGTYTENGRDVYALLHDEWHGWEIPGACPAGPGKRRCGVGGVTFAVSHNNGDSFSQPAPPDNFVATVPPRPSIDDPRTGLFQPTSPVKKGNYFYSIVLMGAIGDQDPGACAMRTRDVTDPSSWRGWNGTGFGVRFRNPYYESLRPGLLNTCEPISYDNILGMSRSLTFNTVLNEFVLTGSSSKFDPVQSKTVDGFYFSLSDDLVHWSMRQLIMEVPTATSHQCGGPDVGSYPALIDHDATDRNFRVTDDTVYLYFTRTHYNEACQITSDNDLLRIPIQFSP